MGVDPTGLGSEPHNRSARRKEPKAKTKGEKAAVELSREGAGFTSPYAHNEFGAYHLNSARQEGVPLAAARSCFRFRLLPLALSLLMTRPPGMAVGAPLREPGSVLKEWESLRHGPRLRTRPWQKDALLQTMADLRGRYHDQDGPRLGWRYL